MIAPSLQTEGKQLQSSQGVGMGSRGAAVGAHSPNAESNGTAEHALAEA
jgi:IMP dehydrogenase